MIDQVIAGLNSLRTTAEDSPISNKLPKRKVMIINHQSSIIPPKPVLINQSSQPNENEHQDKGVEAE